MRYVCRFVATCVLVAGFLFGLGVSPTSAGDLANTRPFDRFLLFTGFDLWRNGGFAHGGLLWSPGGLAREGFALKLLLAGGRYRYNAGTTGIVGTQALASVMGGWRLKYDTLEITVFAGPDLQSNRLTPDDPGNRMRGRRAGARIGGDLWYQPGEAFMANAGVSASTIGPNYWMRGAVGWRLFQRAWFGPELLALGGGRYRQIRLGVHATAFRTQALEWSAGFGYARDSDDRSGAYTHISVIMRG